VQEPIATWNPTRQLWETNQEDFSGLREPYAVTWPTSFMTRAGKLYPLPALVHHTKETEFLSSPPTPQEDLLPTPDSATSPHGHGARGGKPGNGSQSGASLDAVVKDLLPTPMSTDALGARNATSHRPPDSQHHAGTTLTDVLWQAAGITDAEPELLPTPSSADGLGGHINRSGDRGDEYLLGGIARLLPTPQAQDSGGPHGDRGGHRPSREGHQPALSDALTDPALRGGELDEIATHLLPSPFARDYKGAYPRGDKGECLPGALEQLHQHADDEAGVGEQMVLLPTPAAADHDRRQDLARADRVGSGGDDLVTSVVKAERDATWGKYGPAVRRWERLAGPAPSPTEPNRNGNPRLNPQFSEWLMGLPRGWICDVPISRPDKLKICGNGVVPQQAVAALRQLLQIIQEAAW
jgi:hypothetical protein